MFSCVTNQRAGEEVGARVEVVIRSVEGQMLASGEAGESAHAEYYCVLKWKKLPRGRNSRRARETPRTTPTRDGVLRWDEEQRFTTAAVLQKPRRGAKDCCFLPWDVSVTLYRKGALVADVFGRARPPAAEPIARVVFDAAQFVHEAQEGAKGGAETGGNAGTEERTLAMVALSGRSRAEKALADHTCWLSLGIRAVSARVEAPEVSTSSGVFAQRAAVSPAPAEAPAKSGGEEMFSSLPLSEVTEVDSSRGSFLARWGRKRRAAHKPSLSSDLSDSGSAGVELASVGAPAEGDGTDASSDGDGSRISMEVTPAGSGGAAVDGEPRRQGGVAAAQELPHVGETSNLLSGEATPEATRRGFWRFLRRRRRYEAKKPRTGKPVQSKKSECAAAAPDSSLRKGAAYSDAEEQRMLERALSESHQMYYRFADGLSLPGQPGALPGALLAGEGEGGEQAGEGNYGAGGDRSSLEGGSSPAVDSDGGRPSPPPGPPLRASPSLGKLLAASAGGWTPIDLAELVWNPTAEAPREEQSEEQQKSRSLPAEVLFASMDQGSSAARGSSACAALALEFAAATRAGRGPQHASAGEAAASAFDTTLVAGSGVWRDMVEEDMRSDMPLFRDGCFDIETALDAVNARNAARPLMLDYNRGCIGFVPLTKELEARNGDGSNHANSGKTEGRRRQPKAAVVTVAVSKAKGDGGGGGSSARPVTASPRVSRSELVTPLKEVDGGHHTEMSSEKAVWANLQAGTYVVAWCDHFNVLDVSPGGDECVVIDSLGERLFPGNPRAFVLRFRKDPSDPTAPPPLRLARRYFEELVGEVHMAEVARDMRRGSIDYEACLRRTQIELSCVELGAVDVVGTLEDVTPPVTPAR